MAELPIIKTQEDFDKLVQTAGDKAIIVDFHATWCGPCRNIAPFFKELVASHPNVVAAKCDVDEADAFAQAQGVQAMPTFLVFKNGKCVTEDKVTGASKEKLQALFDKYN